MSFKDKFSKFAIKLASALSCATILATGVNGMLSANAADTSGCKMELVGNPCGGAGSCTCGGKDLDIYAVNQGNYGDPLNGNWSEWVYGGGATISYSGCFVASCYISFKMSGIFGDMCPLGFFKMMTGSNFFSGAGLMYGPFANMQDKDGNNSVHFIHADDALINNIAPNGLGYSTALSHETAYKLAVDLAKQGAYVIVKQSHDSSTHWTPVTKVVDSDNEIGATLIVSNVGDQYDDPINGKHGSYIKYKSGDTAPSDDYLEYTQAFPNGANLKGLNEMVAIVIDGHPFTGNVAGSGGSGSDSTFTYTGFCNYLEETYFIDVSKLEERPIEMPVREDLLQSGGLDKIKEIEQWKDNIDNKNEDNMSRYIRAGFMFFGILITIYSVFLYIAYQVDKINNFIDISLLSTLTFGRLNVAPEDTNGNFNTPDSGRAKYLKHKDIIIVCVLGVGIGVLFISGKIFALMGALKTFLDNLFG